MEWPTFTDQQVIDEATRAAKTINFDNVLEVTDAGLSEMLGFLGEEQYDLFLSTFTRELAEHLMRDPNDTETGEEGFGVAT